MKKNLLLLILLLSCATLLTAQKRDEYGRVKYRKSTEIGLGVDMQFLNRVGFQDYMSSPDGDRYTLKIRNVMFGGNLYIARELNPWFYIDLQGTVGVAKAIDTSTTPTDKNNLFAMVGPGIQFRLTPLFKAKYVEPYFRVGANYYYKDFLVMRSSRIENFNNNYLEWTQSDEFNKNADTKKSFFPFSFGFGINSWFSDHFGFGIQGDYLTTFTDNSVSFPRVIARLMIRFGGTKMRMSPPEIQYVEKVVEREVPGERVVEEKIVYRETAPDSLLVLFSNINFDFDQSTLTADSEEVLDGIAPVLMSREMAGKKFLIFGYTDKVGTVEYNNALSDRRAKAVVDGLIERGVPSDMLKSWGVGKSAAIMPVRETDYAREGDRKVTIELVRNMEYWDKLP